MSKTENEKLKAELNAIYEGLVSIVNRINMIEESWQQSGTIVESQEDFSELAKTAFTKAQPMRAKNGFWMWSRDAPKLKELLLKANGKKLDATIGTDHYTVKLGDSREEPDAFLSFWPRK